MIIITHGQCNDGFCAAWVARRKYPDAEIVFALYEDPTTLPDVTDKGVLLFDFCPPRETLIEMHKKAASLQLYDHHKSSMEDCGDLPYCYFDMTRSGAGLAWDTLFPGEERPWIVNYTEDSDLWNWNLPFSKEIKAFLWSLDHDFEVWDEINENIPNPFSEEDKIHLIGKSILNSQLRQMEFIIAHKTRRTTIGGYDVPLINCPHYASDLGSMLSENEPFAAVWHQLANGNFKVSLRSKKGADYAVDVSEVARQYGGGGHPTASAFVLTDAEDIVSLLLSLHLNPPLEFFLVDRRKLDRERLDWEEAHAFIVAAKDSEDARKVAAEKSGEEGKRVWNDPTRSEVTKLGSCPEDTKRGVVITDFAS